MRLTGISASAFKKGGHVAIDNAERGHNEQAIGSGRAIRSDEIDLDWVWDWFHCSKSEDVEPDKETKRTFKRKRAHAAGKLRDLTCELRILKAPKLEAVARFKASPEYSKHV